MIVVDEADLILNKRQDLANYMAKNYALINELSNK